MPLFFHRLAATSSFAEFVVATATKSNFLLTQNVENCILFLTACA